MKKVFFAFIVVLAFTSCYNNKILVGNISENDPVIEVYKVMNSHWIYGLVPAEKTNLKVDEYLKGKKDYIVKTNISFVDGLIGSLTFGIYTPTTTTFYVPLKDVE
ncbi:MAG: Bor family protein [Mangrovibacterium sp.]|jgi:hypothetical protein